MTKIKLIALLASSIAFLGTATGASAQATRTWVSGVGDDVNPCSRTAPCKTFAGAISKTAAGGEINCLDPGGYGAITITKSITIDCRGTLGSILFASVNGVNVNDSATATPGTINVVLRNLSLNGAGTTLGVNGIRFVRGASLTVDNVTIQNFSTAGINIDHAAGAARVHVTDTVINGSTAAGEIGVRIRPTVAAGSQVLLNNVQLIGNFRGVEANATGTSAGNILTISGARIFGNTDNGIDGSSNANALQIMIENTTIANNARALILAGAGVNTRIGGSLITSNTTATSATGGAILQSYRNNQIDLNTNNTTPITQAQLN